jgi:abortive infection bacteriophage resistance protein
MPEKKVFEKQPISIDEQIQWLMDRNLKINDLKHAKHFLTWVSFFRLKPYFHPFQYTNGKFHPDTEFRNIIILYDFDRRLRLLMVDAIERIEVAVRSIINHHMATKYQDAHWYLNENYFNRYYTHTDLTKKIKSLQEKQQDDYECESKRIEKSSKSFEEKEKLKTQRAKENYVRFYTLTYCKPELIPSWSMLEELTMGDLSFLFKGLKEIDKRAIIKSLHLPAFELFQSWLHTITTIRNICAHHSRLWNRELGISPALPKNTITPWTANPLSDNKRIYVILIIFNYLMDKISPTSRWSDRLVELFNEFHQINLHAMGMPDNWQDDFVKSNVNK